MKRINKDNTEKVFTNIYLNNSWGSVESRSGPGSNLFNNKKLLNLLENFVITENIKSIVDCGCGDFNWMKNFNFNLIDNYLGIDIVSPLIEKNIKNYSNEIIKFIQGSVIEDKIDEFDLIFCKDVLFHLSYNDTLKAIGNIKNSNSKYFISTTFYDFKNKDIATGGWRPINLETSPFLMGSPLLLWKNIEGKETGWTSKSIGVWKI